MFDNLILMKSSLNVLDRRAVKAALDQNWEEAVELNTEIIKLNSVDLNAKIRLGKAFLHLGQFPKAKKLFKEILDLDPLNQIAKKNYELAKEGKAGKENHSKTQIIVKEPGTTSEINFTITEPKITSNNFTKGDELEVKILKKAIQVYALLKDKKTYLGDLEAQYTEKLCAAKDKGAEITAIFVSGNGKLVKILLKSSLPIFRGQKQEVKPYTKQTDFDEDETDEEAATTERDNANLDE
jgi:tetratricopeptide (TPR) repeat protein